MIKAVIVDDEASNIENLTLMLCKYCPMIVVADSAINVDQGILAIKEHHPSIVFLDIQMPGKSGFDLLKSIYTPEFEVIFVTAFDQFAIQAIKFSAIDYLLKPLNAIELVNAVDRALINIERKSQNTRLENLIQSIVHKNHLRIAIPGPKEILFISPGEILFCKSDNNYTFFYLANKQTSMAAKPIYEYEELLEPHGFIRCHQSYLVNIIYIKSWLKTDGDRLLLDQGHEIPVSRNSKEKVKRAIGVK